MRIRLRRRERRRTRRKERVTGTHRWRRNIVVCISNEKQVVSETIIYKTHNIFFPRNSHILLIPKKKVISNMGQVKGRKYQSPGESTVSCLILWHSWPLNSGLQPYYWKDQLIPPDTKKLPSYTFMTLFHSIVHSLVLPTIHYKFHDSLLWINTIC